MGFWDFLRKKFEEKEKPVLEKIKQDEIQSWLNKEKKEIEEQEERFSKKIQERILELIEELQEKIHVLEKIDIEEKKVEEKIKLVIKENLDNYIYYIDKLISQLSEINEKPGKGMEEKINSVFSDFNKRSRMSFEKATFIIGKELGNVRDGIRVFFKDLEKIHKENKDIIEKSNTISSLETKIKRVSEVNETKSGLEKRIGEYSEKIKELDNKIKVKEEEIEKIKKSEKFLKENRKKQEIIDKKQELEKEIDKLREIIDFKALASFFHSFEKEMSIIKEYKENFKKAFEKTKGEELVALFRESKLPSLEILNKIQDITERKSEIKSIVIQDVGIENIESEIENIKSELGKLAIEKLTEEKRYKKLEGNLNQLIDTIRKELTKMNVEVE